MTEVYGVNGSKDHPTSCGADTSFLLKMISSVRASQYFEITQLRKVNVSGSSLQQFGCIHPLQRNLN